jgi:hypothetical protein
MARVGFEQTTPVFGEESRYITPRGHSNCHSVNKWGMKGRNLEGNSHNRTLLLSRHYLREDEVGIRT